MRRINWCLGVVSFLFVPLSAFVAVTLAFGSDRSVQGKRMAPAAKLDPRILDLINTTYLGSVEDFPDPDESYEILAQYVRRDTHKYLPSAESPTKAQDLDLDIAHWEALVGAAPPSRHGYAALGELYEIKYEQTTDKSWLRQAAVMYEEAVRTALDHRRIRFTDKLGSILSAVGDLERLHTAFCSVLSLAPDADPGHYNLALVNYADSLAQLGQLDLAWNYFEQAIAANPKGCIFAVNLYTDSLLQHNLPAQALTVLERTFTADERIILAQPAFARRKALQMAEMDTSSADREINAVRANFKRGQIGGGMDSIPTSPGPSAGALSAHTNAGDDCRVMDYHTLFVDSATGAWFFCYTVNEAEVMYNEARGETRGGQALVAWTIRDRALEVLKGVSNSDGTWAGISCDSYFGDGYSHGTCSVLPCEDVNFPNCPFSQLYCCAIHGGTTWAGAQ